MRLLLWFLCDSTPHKLFGRRSWNSTQRLVLLLTMLPWKKILEKSSGSGSGGKNILFTFLGETILLINEFFWNFAHEDIINSQIILLLIVLSCDNLKGTQNIMLYMLEAQNIPRLFSIVELLESVQNLSVAYTFHSVWSSVEIMCIAFIVLLLENTELFYVLLLFCL